MVTGERRVHDEGFAAFFAQAYPRLLGQVRALTGDLASAEDVVQEALVRAASRWRQLARYDQPEAWVRKTAFRLAIDRLRRRRRQSRLLTRLRRDQEPTLTLQAEDREVIAALQRLPLPLREALVLHYCLDLAVGEIAAQTGVSVGTIKSRLSRGRDRLAVLLGVEAAASEEGHHATP